MEVTINKNIKFTQSQMQQIEKAITDYNFKNVSEVVREGVKIFFKFLEIKDKFEDPNVSRKFVEETEELLRAEKEFDRLQACIGKFTDEELERNFFVMSQERNSRVKTKVKTIEDNRDRLQKGGELEPRVGYHLVNHNGYEFYEPIDPPDRRWTTNDDGGWNTLSQLDKITLRDELVVKLSELQQRFSNDDHMTSQLDGIVRRINEQLEKEKRMIR